MNIQSSSGSNFMDKCYLINRILILFLLAWTCNERQMKEKTHKAHQANVTCTRHIRKVGLLRNSGVKNLCVLSSYVSYVFILNYIFAGELIITKNTLLLS